MLYKPNFCCHCGEKVERIQWKLWTSRRFCENCEQDFRKEEWLPIFLLGLAMISGLYGLGSFLKSPEKPLKMETNQFAINSSNRAQIVKTLPNGTEANLQNQSLAVASNRQTRLNKPDSAKDEAQISQPAALKDNSQNLVEEPVFFCGAQTKKGTPCTRKVKGGGRCWQHAGQPAMLPKEKLIITQ